jgi:hypothetical protein
MLLFRAVLMLLLVLALLAFAAFAFTGHPAWKARGLQLLKWAIGAALVFGLVLAVPYLLAGR